MIDEVTESPLVSRTLDEETRDMCDTYDASITPYTIARDTLNTGFNILRSIAQGFLDVRDTVISLRDRFDARFCDEDQLESAMWLVGERHIPAKKSVLRMVITNDGHSSVTLAAGEYRFMSATSVLFIGEITSDRFIEPGGIEVALFASEQTGVFEVSGETNVAVLRADGEDVSPDLVWDALENSGTLGKPAETWDDVRQRILTQTDRQDTIRELELNLNSLPRIFRCDLVFNPANEVNEGLDETVIMEDGEALEPKTLRIVVTGVVDDEFAQTVMSRNTYRTHKTSNSDVIFYRNPLFVNGRIPVYYSEHRKRLFNLAIHYRYDRDMIRKSDADAMYERMFRHLRFMTDRIDIITEPYLYRLSGCTSETAPGLFLHKIYLQDTIAGERVTVADIHVPKLMLPMLDGPIVFISQEIHGRPDLDD